MGNVHLVTGYAGKPHVTASDHGSLLEALIRSGDFVLEAGKNFMASIITNNQIRISDGELVMQGRHVKLNPGAYVDLVIENGSQGYARNDIIAMRYTRDTETGIEDANLVVIKGIASSTTAVDPVYSIGSINSGTCVMHDFPLYRVELSGLNVGMLVKLFDTQKTVLASCLSLLGGIMNGPIDMNRNKLSGLNEPAQESEAANKRYVDKEICRSLVRENLLDNGNLANAINQRGYTGYAAKVQKYTIDRWLAAALLEVNYIAGDGYVELDCSDDATERNGFVQYLAPEKTPAAGTPVTLAYEDVSGNLTVYNRTMPASGSVGQNDTSAVGFRLYSAAEDARVALMIPPGVRIRVAWIAMYEGTFTKDDLPAFRPKDYSAELMECMRYFQIRSTGDVDPVDLRPTMRDTPTVTKLDDGRYAYSAEL